MKCIITDFNIELDMDPITYGIALQVLRKVEPFRATLDAHNFTCTINCDSDKIKCLADLVHYTKLLMDVLGQIDGLAKAAHESLTGVRNPLDVPEKKS